MELKKHVDLAEEKIKERNINTVEDLNIGDLALFLEVTMPMEIHPDYSWHQYPNLNHLYSVCKKIECFDKVHKPFLDWCRMIRQHQEINAQMTLGRWMFDIFVGGKMIMKMIYLKVFGYI